MDNATKAALMRAASEAIAYRERIATADSTPAIGYREIYDAFAGPVPETGGNPDEIIDELIRKATPGLRAVTAPRFFGWVKGNSHLTGVAADWLTSAWGQNVGNLIATPAASAVETVTAEWLLDLLGLPAQASIGFVTGGTVANFVALAAARNDVLCRVGWDVEADGLFGAPPITVLIGDEAHATIYSGLRYLGLGAQRVVKIPSDEAGRIRPDAFHAALAACEGPIIAILQAGQINTGACDDFATLIPMAHAKGAWVHVDGAFGLWAQAAPGRKHLTNGVEAADSWGTDGHKWLQTPYDCGFAIVRNAEAHRRAMAIVASYLPPADGPDREPSAYVPELSRRARGFSTWAVIKALGREGIAEMVERNCQVAAHMAARLDSEPGIRNIAPVTLNQFMVRFGDDDALTRATIERIQHDAVAFFGGTLWQGQWMMRASVCSIATTMDEGDRAADAAIHAWRQVKNG